ncbi:MAG: hypothetical protein Q8S13_09340 [Dehalococcoidia bacterium]|nr:hypothetical protein [Dehalococcoidia bacterium]
MSAADRFSMQDFRVWFKGQPAEVRERVLHDLRCEHEYLVAACPGVGA